MSKKIKIKKVKSIVNTAVDVRYGKLEVILDCSSGDLGKYGAKIIVLEMLESIKSEVDDIISGN